MSDGRVQKAVERVARGPWLARAAGFGFVAKGVVYAVIGSYALMLATGQGGGFLDAKDAPRAVQRQPFGDVLLVLLGVGLACHALARLVAAFARDDDGDSALKRAGKRAAAIGGGVVAGFLSLTAFQHLVGRSHRPSWVQRVLRWDGGDDVVIAIGAGFIVAGGYQLYRAATQKFQKQLETHELSSSTRTWLMRICRFGVAARGAVLLVVGWLFVVAGVDDDARKATGTGAALRTIMHQRAGMWLLGIAAAGLIAYALFMVVNARYRRALA